MTAELTQAGRERMLETQYLNAAYPMSARVLSELNRIDPRGVDGRGFSNDNIADVMRSIGVNTADLEPEITHAFGVLLRTMCIRAPLDHNSEGSAARYARMVLEETMAGRYTPEPSITDFPNVRNADQLIIVQGLRVESICSHHHQNIRGVCHVGVLPAETTGDGPGKVIGLSKYSRIVRYYARRPQIQEELTVQIAQHIDRVTQPRGVVVVVEAEHQCMAVRGVNEPEARTRTIHLIGEMLTEPNLRNEFYANIR